jgi:hypothetical protein
MIRKLLVALVTLSVLAFSVAGLALAADPHSPGNPTGQPSQSCQAEPNAPGGGNRANSPGSPFAGASSANNYAGSQPQNSKNPKSVSQYDVACFQNSQPGHPIHP